MFCSQCGKELNENVKFCSECGAPVNGEKPVNEVEPAVVKSEMANVDETVVLQETTKKKSKTGLIIGLIALALVVVAGAVTAIILTSPVNQIKRAFAAGDVDKAIALYEEVTQEKDMEKVTAYATSYAAQMKDDYLNEVSEVDYDTAYQALEKLNVGITKDNKEISEMKEFVEQVGVSREHYQNAQLQEESGNYVDALELYASVMEADLVYYEKAQASVTSVSDKIREEALTQIRSYAEACEFDAAQEELDYALSILKDDAELLAEQDSLNQMIIDDYVNRAKTAVAEEHYTDALNIINVALQEFPENESIISVKDAIPEEAYLIGTWELTSDISEALAMIYGDEFVGDDPLEMSVIYSFREDGTYYCTVDEDSFMETFYNFMLEFIYVSFESEGMSREDANELVESMYDMSMEDYIYMICAIELDDLNNQLYESGDYTVEGNKLYLDDSDDYEIFTVSGDVLTLDLPGEEAGAELFPGFSYPLILNRVDNVMTAEGNI